MKNLVNNPIKFAFDEMKKSIYTANIGRVLAFNPQNQRAQVQAGVQRVDIDGSTHNPPVIIDVPVLFLGGSHMVEFEVQPNDEGLIVFLQRNIDGWKQTGGVASNPTPRILSGQDAVFIHGVRSLPNVISGFSNDGIRLRNRSGSTHVWIKNDGTIVSDNEVSTIEQDSEGNITLNNDTATHKVNADGSITMENGGGFIRLMSDGTAVINGMTIPPVGQGDASYDGTIKAQEVETNSGIQLGTHTHGGVVVGGESTEGPQ